MQPRHHPADRLFGRLLWLYPAAFRDEYATEIRSTLRYRWRDEAAIRGSAGMALFSLGIVWDTVRTAGEEHINMLSQDIRLTFRMLARSPLFAISAILTIALGIGATTAIFSIVDHVLLRPLPFPQSSQLLTVRLPHPTEGVVQMSVADFVDWRQQDKTFQDIAAFADRSFTVRDTGDSVMINGVIATAGFFSTLRAQAMIGRTFQKGDDEPGQPRRVVLSYQLWRTRFHEDPNIAGRVVMIESQPQTIVGVMGPDFAFPSNQELLWTIQPLDPPRRRGPYFLFGLARMPDGMTLETATARLNASIVQNAYGASQKGAGERMQFYVRPLRDLMVGGAQTSLLVLLGAVALVLLIACVNVANLLLVRSAARDREIVLRISLGANARQLLRQLLTESMIISALGAACGLAIAGLALRWYEAAGSDLMMQFVKVDLDWRVLAFTAGTMVFSGLLFGLAPALRAARMEKGEALRAGRGATGGPKADRARTALILGEVALAYALVMGAGLLIRSYHELSKVSAGARADHLMTFRVALPQRRYPPPAAVDEFYRKLLSDIQQIPGVEAAGASSALPPDRLSVSDEYIFEQKPLAPNTPLPVAPLVMVTPDYFRAAGIPILRGRAFNDLDKDPNPPVAIISNAMAQKYFAGENAVGKRMRQGGLDRSNPWMEIVGVAADAKYTGLNVPDQPVYYKPESQSFMSSMYVSVRTSIDPQSAAPALRAAVAALDPELALDRMQSMGRNMAESVSRPRLQMTLLSMLAGLGLLLSGIGVYGVVAYSVAKRTPELGVRAALGASRGELLWLVMRQGMRPVLAGLVAGVAGALIVGQAARSLLFGVGPQDPLVLVLGFVVIGTVGLLACVLPALRATRIDPAVVLRGE